MGEAARRRERAKRTVSAAVFVLVGFFELARIPSRESRIKLCCESSSLEEVVMSGASRILVCRIRVPKPVLAAPGGLP